jgi:hypothetical protein
LLISRLCSTSKDIPKAFTTLSIKKVGYRDPMLLHLLLFVRVPRSSSPTGRILLRAGDDCPPLLNLA